jgi:hypothetical protein
MVYFVGLEVEERDGRIKWIPGARREGGEREAGERVREKESAGSLVLHECTWTETSWW